MKSQQKDLFNSFQEINRLSQEGQLFKKNDNETPKTKEKPNQDA